MFHQLAVPFTYMRHEGDFVITYISSHAVKGYYLDHHFFKVIEIPTVRIRPHSVEIDRWKYSRSDHDPIDIIAINHLEMMKEIRKGVFVPLAKPQFINNDYIVYVNYEFQIGLKVVGGFLAESDEHMPLRLFDKVDWREEGF